MKLCKEKIEECADWVRTNGLMRHGGAMLKDFCAEMDISAFTYGQWMKKPIFSSAIKKAQKDFESTLATRLVKSLARAAEGYIAPPEVRVEKDGNGNVVRTVETTKPVPPNIGAAIFLLTNLNDGEWKNGRREPSEAQAMPPEMREEVQKLIAAKVEEYTEVLRERGKYTAEISAMINVAAVCMVRFEMASREVFSDSHSPIMVEHSREGNERQSVNPRETLFQKYAVEAQDALRAIGMTMDSKERSTDGEDTSADFLTKHRIEQ